MLLNKKLLLMTFGTALVQFEMYGMLRHVDWCMVTDIFFCVRLVGCENGGSALLRN